MPGENAVTTQAIYCKQIVLLSTKAEEEEEERLFGKINVH